jgi:hypothetical protein
MSIAEWLLDYRTRHPEDIAAGDRHAVYDSAPRYIQELLGLRGLGMEWNAVFASPADVTEETRHARQAAAAEREAARVTRESARTERRTAVALDIAASIAMNGWAFAMANGKTLKDCTAQDLKQGAKWQVDLAKRVPRGKTVGDVMTDAQVREHFRAFYAASRPAG